MRDADSSFPSRTALSWVSATRSAFRSLARCALRLAFIAFT
jgi:hypothetical protein